MPRILSVVGYAIVVLAIAQLASGAHRASALVHNSASASLPHEAQISSTTNGDGVIGSVAGLAALASHDYGFMVGLAYDPFSGLQQELYEIDMLGNVVLQPGTTQAQPMLKRTSLDFPDEAMCTPGFTKFGINYRKPWQMITHCNNNNVSVDDIIGAEFTQAYQLDALSALTNAEPQFKLRPNGETLITSHESFYSIAAGVYQGHDVFFGVGGGLEDVGNTVYIGSADGTGTISTRLNTTQALADAGMQLLYAVAYLETATGQYVYLNDAYSGKVLQVNVNNVADVIVFSTAGAHGTGLAIDATTNTAPRLVVTGQTAQFKLCTIDVIAVPLTSSTVVPLSSRIYPNFGLYNDYVSIVPLPLPLSGSDRTSYRAAQALRIAPIRVAAEAVVLQNVQTHHRGQSTLVLTGYDAVANVPNIYTFVIDANGHLPANATVFVANATLPSGQPLGIAMYNRGEDFSTKN